MSLVLDRSDEDARRLIAEAIDQTLVVEAAAGTGKTTELVSRIITVVAEGRATVREIVAVTFTEKAAGELKLRLRQRLEVERQRAAHPDAAKRLEEALHSLEDAHVSTIHGFCADLLRERPVEARVDPLFRVLTEGQAERLFDQAFASWFQEHLEEPPEGMRRSLRRPGRGWQPGQADEDGPMERLRRAGFELTQWRDFDAPWSREPFDRVAAIERVVRLVHALAAVSGSPSYGSDNLFIDTEPVRRLSAELEGVDVLAASIDEVDLLEARLIELRRHRDFKRARKGTGPTYGKGRTRAEVLEARGQLTLALDELQQAADADLAARLREELRDCIAGYEMLKRREGALDFLDLLLRARDLVVQDAAVRAHFQSRFTRIFVDEFQDTDPLQAELLMLLAADDPAETEWQRARPVPGKLFIVGDPKQSIYRFRRADVHAYTRVSQLLIDAGATRVELRRSFRAVPNIQRFVNAAFAPLMAGDRAGYVPLEPHRDDRPEQPSVVALPVPEPYGPRFVSAKAIEQSLPEAVGAYVEWLVTRSGWTVSERRDSSLRVPLEARHICILFRRFISYGEDITRKYVDALEARGIKHLLVGGKAFHNREEIETIRAVLTAIEWPDDQLSVFAALRGSLFAIGDEELLEYHHRCGRFHPFRVLDVAPSHLMPVCDALTLLATLHRGRNRRSVADTIFDILDRTRAHVGLVLRPGGEQALANVLHVAELARQYEQEGGISFRGFVEALQEATTGSDAAEAPILEEGSDGVRLMTVHKAKGLEFPVVVLADITARLTPFEAGRHIDQDRRLCALRIGGWSPADLARHQQEELEEERREGERVAYVAATRARDLLVVPAVGDGPYEDGWTSPLHAALYPPPEPDRVAQPARGCPLFKSRDTVLRRPDGDPATSFTVRPGQHDVDARDGRYSVVWWSPEPGVLPLGAEPHFGLRRDDLIVKDVAPAVLDRYVEAYTSWRAARQAAADNASSPSLRVRTVTEWAATSDATLLSGAAAVETIALDRGEDRPSGPRHGTLVHAVLATIPLDADASTVSRFVETQARIVGATTLEVQSASSMVRDVLEHPLLAAARRADAAGRCFREVPVTATLEDELIEGVVDLAFEEDGVFTVVDFKTDRATGSLLGRYERQVSIYVEAIARATNQPARGTILRV